jgi:deoxyribodipyrimidine photolyase-related protein
MPVKKKKVLILGDQLFSPEFWSDFREHEFILIESDELCTHFQYHQHKLIFFLSSMRAFRDEMTNAGFQVRYSRLDSQKKGRRFFEELSGVLGDGMDSGGDSGKSEVTEVVCAEVSDRFFEGALSDFFRKKGIPLRRIRSPAFLTSRDRLKAELCTGQRPFMKRFYESQRRSFKILLERDGSPVGGRWSFDTENRKKLPQKLKIPEFPRFSREGHVSEVSALVSERFPTHPGNAKDFWLPTTRQEARELLGDFIRNRLPSFGPYEDAIHPLQEERGNDRALSHATLFHSALSPLLNNGLLTPEEVVGSVLKAYEGGRAPIESVEGFIRQIIGWREFIFGMDQYFHQEFEGKNFWKHERPLPKAWHEARMGIPPLDDVLKKVERFGYAHHIERLMILANFMNLLQIQPTQAYQWFMERFVDSADWVMGPNVFGMGLMSDGGLFATKPYLCGSNYILKMSHYEKGPWTEKVDALYWAFIGRNLEFFSGQPRLGMMAVQYRKMTDEKRSRLSELSEKLVQEWWPRDFATLIK